MGEINDLTEIDLVNNTEKKYFTTIVYNNHSKLTFSNFP